MVNNPEFNDEIDCTLRLGSPYYDQLIRLSNTPPPQQPHQVMRNHLVLNRIAKVYGISSMTLDLSFKSRSMKENMISQDDFQNKMEQTVSSPVVQQLQKEGKGNPQGNPSLKRTRSGRIGGVGR